MLNQNNAKVRPIELSDSDECVLFVKSLQYELENTTLQTNWVYETFITFNWYLPG